MKTVTFNGLSIEIEDHESESEAREKLAGVADWLPMLLRDGLVEIAEEPNEEHHQTEHAEP